MARDRRLYRSRDDKWFGGVAGGLGDYFGISSTKLRWGFFFFGLFGAGELVYIILWIIIDKEPR